MYITVEISKYPLREDFLPRILDFIDRINTYEGIKVRTNETSTHISGEYQLVMEVLQNELSKSFESLPETIFVLKILGKDLL
jgi:uncharacterized protein YqgV (UPF0045/DUF77 family)